MSSLSRYFCSTIGRKQFVGLTGLGLTLFVLAHVSGNFLLFVGPEAYNKYSHALISNPFIYVAEAGLVIAFAIHFSLAMKLTLENFKARPEKYAVSSHGDKGTSSTTKSMWAQGAILLVFVVYHLITFKYGTYYEAEYDGVVMRDLHRLVMEVFQSPAYVGWYLVCLVVLGFHLSHGVSSAFQSLGFNHPQYTPKMKCLGMGVALYVALGFITQPLYVFFIFKG